MNDPAITVDRLGKRFDEIQALRDVSFAVERSELFAFIGPDGAGKTTLFRILATLLVPDQGDARVLGYDVVKQLRDIRSRLGYMAGRFSLYPDLSVEENLEFYASVFGTTIRAEYDRIRTIYSQLEPFKSRRAGALSGGMKQKLALSCALVHRPTLLLLDEPTTGVDAVSRREFWDMLDELKASGLTIVVSTPYMDEANRCDRVALINKGTILAIDPPSEITRAFDRPLLAIRVADRYRTLLALREFEHAHTVFPFGETLHYTDQRRDGDLRTIVSEVARFLTERGFAAFVEPTAASIEDVFMERLA